MRNLNVHDISSHIRQASKFNTFGKLKTQDIINDGDKIKDCIEAFKESIKSLFKEHHDVECFTLIPKHDEPMDITIFKDKLIFDKHNDDGSMKQLVLDFRSNTLKSDAIVITNLKTLERLFSYLNYLYREFVNDRAVLYESKFEMNDEY